MEHYNTIVTIPRLFAMCASRASHVRLLAVDNHLPLVSLWGSHNK